jgi:hypothetical protein
MPRTLLLALTLALLAAGVALAATARVTPERVGRIHLGDKYATLHAKGLLGRSRMGCELAGPGTRAAPLRAPLRGIANLTKRAPRRVRDITVTKGAAARGVGIGATIADIKATFPTAKVDHSTDTVFRYTLVRVPKSGGGRIAFAVDTTTDEVISIGIPFIAACE